MADTKYSMERIDAMEGREFEHFIAALLRKLGYEKVEVTPGSGDQGVDVLAEKEGVRYAVQCKCYSSDLGNTPVQEVNTGKVIYHCHVGIVVTNHYFTQGAKEAAKATGVLLWDRDKLRNLMAKTNLMSETSFSARHMASDDNEREKRRAKQRAEEQKKRNEEYKQVIISYLYVHPELFSTVDNVREKVLRSAYPTELWTNHKTAYLLNDLCDKEGKLVRAEKRIGEATFILFKLSETEHHRQKAQEVILSYLSKNSELAVTQADIVKKVLMSTYPDEQWSDTEIVSLLNDLCDNGDSLIRAKDKMGNDAFVMTEKAPRQRTEDSLTLWSGSPLLKRGGIALKDEEWKKASQFFERVLNADAENAEAYLGLVMAEAKLSDADDFIKIYINNPFRLSRLNQSNLRHAKEFAGKELSAWFMKLEKQQKEVEVQRKKKTEQSRKDRIDTTELSKIRERNEEYKQCIVSWLSDWPCSATSIKTKLEYVYSKELWSDGKIEDLFNALIFEGRITFVEGSNGTFTLTESERKRREAEAEEERKRKQAEAEAEHRRQEEERAEAERRRIEELAKQKATLEAEQIALQTELANLKGLFTGRRRREIEAKLAEIEQGIKSFG